MFISNSVLLANTPACQYCSKCCGAIILTVWTSMVSKPREMMSSIPSTIVRPLHDNGIPAGPNLIGNYIPPQVQANGHLMIRPFRYSGKKTRKKVNLAVMIVCDTSSMRGSTRRHEQFD